MFRAHMEVNFVSHTPTKNQHLNCYFSGQPTEDNRMSVENEVLSIRKKLEGMVAEGEDQTQVPLANLLNWKCNILIGACVSVSYVLHF